MGSGEFFLAALAGMFFGTIVLALHLLAMFRAGQWLGARSRPNRPLWRGILALGLTIGPLSLWPFLLDWDGFIQVGAALAFYVAVAFPLAMGFGAARDLRERQIRRRWRKNADDWLGEWECEPAPVSSEDEE